MRRPTTLFIIVLFCYFAPLQAQTVLGLVAVDSLVGTGRCATTFENNIGIITQSSQRSYKIFILNKYAANLHVALEVKNQVSNENGILWNKIEMPSPDVIIGVADSTVQVGKLGKPGSGKKYCSKLLISRDAGGSWEWKELDSNTCIGWVAMKDSARGLMLVYGVKNPANQAVKRDPKIFRTRDCFKTLELVRCLDSSEAMLRPKYLNDGAVAAALINSETKWNKVIISKNDFADYDTLAGIKANYLKDVQIADDKIFFATDICNNKYRIYRLRAGGVEPEKIFEPDSGFIITNISALDSENICIAGCKSFFNKIFMTEDGGKSFSEVSIPIYNDPRQYGIMYLSNKGKYKKEIVISTNVLNFQSYFMRMDDHKRLKMPEVSASGPAGLKPYTLKRDSVTLSWSRIGGADEYEVNVYGKSQTDGCFNDDPYVFDEMFHRTHYAVSALVKDTFLLLPKLWKSNYYKARVRARCKSENWSDWGFSPNFKTEMGTLTPPVIVSPEKKYMIMPCNKAEIIWNKVPGATSYDLCVWENSIVNPSKYFTGMNYYDTSYVAKSLDSNRSIVIYVRALNDEEIGPWAIMRFSAGAPVGVEEITQTGRNEFYPNPVCARATIRVDREADCNAAVRAIDMSGREALLWSGTLPAGRTDIPINMAEFARGFYNIVIESGTSREFVKVMKE